MTEPSVPARQPETRYALYYPYIHIRDENWLKGAILSFQKVRRLVPQGFVVRDKAITNQYAGLNGPAGPLFDPLFVEALEIRSTQEWLREKITERIDELKPLYAEETVPEEFLGGPQAFQMHTGKFLDKQLLALLMEETLAWFSRDPGEPDSFNWVTMHPKLGAAMMSVLALAVARLKGLCVVTPSAAAHQELLANQEQAVFEKLLEIPLPPTVPPTSDVAVEELSHIVITMGFDLTRLTPEQICELLKQGKDLASFRAAVATFANRIPSGLDREERSKRLKQEAQAVLEEWNGYTKDLPSFAKDALVDSALDKVPDKVIEKAFELGAEATLASALGVLPGLLISVAVSTGIKMFRRPDTPLRFLTRVDKVVNRSIGSIYVPQWSSLTGQMP